MSDTTAAQPQTEAKETFAALLEESLGTEARLDGTVLRGRIVAIENDDVVIDVGLKSEGRVALREFSKAGEDSALKVGGEVEVHLERMEVGAG